MGFFKKMLRKYDPIVNLSRLVGVPILAKKKADPNRLTPRQKTQQKIDDDTVRNTNRALAIKRGKR